MVENKVVIITGGAGLLGFEFASSIANNGGIAIIGDIDREKGFQALKELSDDAIMGKSEFYELDISSEESINKLINVLHKKYGRIDAWVNNAYPKIKSIDKNLKREYSKAFLDIDVDEFCESISLNIGSYFLCSQLISRYFIKQGYGNIINISSIYGVIPPRFEIYDHTKMTMPLDYAINKSAMIHFTKYLAKFLKNKNIRVNTLSPGGILNDQPSPFIDAYNSYSMNKGMLDKHDISGTLLFLISDSSKYINGQNIIIDDGWTL